MKVGELVVRLSELNQDADVCFDTEAQHFDVHLVTGDSAWPISTDDIGREIVCLHEDAPHRTDVCAAESAALEAENARLREAVTRIAQGACYHGDLCQPDSGRDYRCNTCEARAALAAKE
jgi:hypothetical protein